MAMIGASSHGGGALKPYPVAPSSALLWFASSLRRSPNTWGTHRRTRGRLLSSLDRPHDRKRRESQSHYRFGNNTVSCQYGSEELNGAASFVNESIGCSSVLNGGGSKSSLEIGMYSAVGSDRLQMQQESKSEWVREGQKYRLLKMADQVRKEIRSGLIPVTGSYPDSRVEFLNEKNSEHLNFCSAAVLSETLGSSTIDDPIVLNGNQFASLDTVRELFPRTLRDETQVENSPQEGEGIHAASEAIKSVVQNGRISQKVSTIKPDGQISNGTISTVRPDVALVDDKERLAGVYEKVLIVDNVSTAKEVVKMLTTKYKNVVHACDTEVANIDVKSETPVGHGEIICFSICPGLNADFGNGKSCIWVDVLDGGKDVLMEFVPFFEDESIKKVWHNYSFDSHIVNNYGIKLAGFHADTMHLARLWDSSRRADGGYSLEALTSNSSIMSEVKHDSSDDLNMGKISMKTIFAKKKLKKDGSEGKQSTIAPVEVLQREERKLWICYSALDSLKTSELFHCLKAKLSRMPWILDGINRGTMYDFYEEYWRPFGALLVKMESEGMLVDRNYLSEIEKVAIAEQQMAADRFRKWASKYCPDAKYMNVGSDTQIRQLLFGGIQNSKDQNEYLPFSKTFKVPNTENVIEEGKKTPSKYRNIELCNIAKNLKTDMYTASGWPSVSGAALKVFAGKISTDLIYLDDENSESYSICDDEDASESSSKHSGTEDTSSYGTAYFAFGEGREGRDACHAIAALCEVCSIDSLISNFILPLQGNHISCYNGRVHCSLNINTETGRLSARRPNLQNQPALEKDRYKIRQAFIAEPGNSLIVADYGQLELRILAHLAQCKSMLEAFEAGGDFHSRTAMNMYDHVRKAVEEKRVMLEWYPQPGQEKPPVPLLKDAFAAERRKAKMLNFSIAYGKTPVGLSRDWKVSVKEAKKTVDLWYKERQEVLKWQEARKMEARTQGFVRTLLGRSRRFPSIANASNAQKGHIERAAINTPVQGSAADVAMCAMLEIERNVRLKELGWRLLLQVHDEVILEGPSDSADLAKAIVVECMSKPFYGTNFLSVDLSVDAKCEKSWYAAK